MDELTLQFLGTGAAEGIPSPFCRCRVCENARQKGGREIRLRSSFRVSKEVLVDFGPDILAACSHLGVDLCDLRHILITHTHEDHLDLGSLTLKTLLYKAGQEKIHVYLNGDAWQFLEAIDKMGFCGREHYFTEELQKGFEFHRLSFFEPCRIGEHTVTPIRGEHPAHFEKNAASYLFDLADGRRLLYALDTGHYERESMDYLRGRALDLLVIECTFGSMDRGDTPYSHLDLRSVLHLCSEFYGQGTLTDRSRVYLTHINQVQSYTHEELEAICAEKSRELPYTITPAYDGMRIEG